LHLKRPDVAIEATAQVQTAHPELQIRVVLAGAATRDRRGRRLRTRLLDLAARLEVDVELCGQIDREQLRERYRRARLVAVPSEFESFSMVCAEGLLSGRPVVASPGVGATDVLAGAIDLADGASAFATTMTSYLLDPDFAEERGKGGRAVVVATLDPVRVTAERLALYETVATRRSV
jgi:glycosyltransferase involved in cell wall biosynthesis